MQNGFTKRHFVGDKNTQQLDGTYKIQFLFLNMNMDLLFKNNQRPLNDCQFPFQWIYADLYCVSYLDASGIQEYVTASLIC